MTDDKKPEEKKPVTVKQALQNQKNDTSWKKEPWVGDDGFQYRTNRVKNPDGTYTTFNVRVGSKPIVEPKENA